MHNSYHSVDVKRTMLLSPSAGRGMWVGHGALALAILAALTGGCEMSRFSGSYDSQGSRLIDIATVAEFDQKVLRSSRPVLVDFYKESCPTCVLQEAVLDDLAAEYGSQVIFAKFKIREATMVGSAPEIMDRYNLFWVPTVILFLDGRETRRWTLNSTHAMLRKGLSQTLAASGPVPNTRSGTGLPGGVKCVEGQGCRIERPQQNSIPLVP